MWKHFEITIGDQTWTGNPFDVELSASFVHEPTGRRVNHFGFFAGNDTWRILFMPDEEGEWTFSTISPDSDLNGFTGSFSVVAGDLPGPLVPTGERRWQLSRGGAVAPVLIPTREWFKSTETANGVDEFIVWADETVKALVIGTTLVYFHHPAEASVYLPGEEGDELNIAMWDRLEEHYSAVRDRGMGHYIMIYSDDEEAPTLNGVDPRSAEELRLLRYVVARLAPYPIVLWDTGIDIGETRSNEWIEWFVDWMHEHDPWAHPVGSRSGGGSGGVQPQAADYWSDGEATLPEFDTFTDEWESRAVPTIFTDRWREGGDRGGWTRASIRQAVWQFGLLGGTGVYISGNENGGYLGSDYASDFLAAPDVGTAQEFFLQEVEELGSLNPRPDLVIAPDGAFAAANPDREYVAYLPSGGAIELDLEGEPSPLSGFWYDPRNGTRVAIPDVQSGPMVRLESPGEADWVLYLAPVGG